MIAGSPADVVSRAGGWLFDRAMSGWDVTVAVASPGDTRPLSILGLGVVDLGCVLNCRRQVPVPQAFAVAGELTEFGEPAREWAYRYMGSARTDVRLWGESGCDETIFAQASPTQYTPSVAARAFKARALESAGIGPPVVEAESFRAVVGPADESGVRTFPAC